jgi:hypothetical protein
VHFTPFWSDLPAVGFINPLWGGHEGPDLKARFLLRAKRHEVKTSAR